ncbi:MAG: hypothetical protein K2L59_07515, partial [Muribaculaceae bacterium]|nr:hypothetical protein [Muribaculaceae bacterium]
MVIRDREYLDAYRESQASGTYDSDNGASYDPDFTPASEAAGHNVNPTPTEKEETEEGSQYF